MSKKNLYDAVIAIVSDPNSFLNWLDLEKIYLEFNLNEESQIIKNYRNKKFEEPNKDDNNSDPSQK